MRPDECTRGSSTRRCFWCSFRFRDSTDEFCPKAGGSSQLASSSTSRRSCSRSLLDDTSADSGAARSRKRLGTSSSGRVRVVRHPIYTAILGMFIGMAIVSGDLHTFVAVAVIAFAYGRKIRLEERNLADLFGAEDEDYRRRTRALVPWVI